MKKICILLAALLCCIAFTVGIYAAEHSICTAAENEAPIIDEDMLMILIMMITKKYEVEIIPGEGGTVASDTEGKVHFRKDVVCTITPDAGYRIADVLVDGRSVGAADEYVFRKITRDHKIEAIFERVPWENPYADVEANSASYEDIRFVSEAALMDGVSADTFAPDTAMRRADLITAIWRMAGKPVVNYIMPFTDVDAEKPYGEAIRWAASCGIAEGSDGKFRPEEALTREQLAMILYRYEKHNGGGFRGMWMFRLNYTDTAKLSDGAYEPMCWMTMKGIYIPRADNSLDPAENATRTEAAGMLRRFCELNR